MTDNISFKQRVRNIAVEEAKYFKIDYIDTQYLILSKNFKNKEFYIITAEKDNYLHLLGVNTNLSCKDFFDKCYNGTLLEQEFDFNKKGQSEKNVKGSVRRKIATIKYLHKLFYDEFLIEEDYQSNSLRCAIMTSDGNNITLGFSYGYKSYPMSLLKGNQMKSEPVLPDLVLTKGKDNEKFNKIIVGNKNVINEFRDILNGVVDTSLFD
ncbi:MAG: PBECR4 domain-containing protein [Coprobacillaceae bacterium]